MEIKDRFTFNGLTAIVADYVFYTDNSAEIDQWLQDRNCERKGMVIKFNNEKTKTMFIMRWL